MAIIDASVNSCARDQLWNALNCLASTFPRKSRSDRMTFDSMQDSGNNSKSVLSDNGYAAFRVACVRLNTESASGLAKHQSSIAPPCLAIVEGGNFRQVMHAAMRCSAVIHHVVDSHLARAIFVQLP